MKLKAPILFIAFNRPDVTEISFSRIRELKPSKLFVAIDGPRKDNEKDKDLRQSVIDITNFIDWDAEVNYLIQKDNLGCRDAVVQAITWALDKEDRIIIVEDDVVPELAFFEFADNLLEFYKNDERIGMISANNYTPIESVDQDYYFSKYAHIWGWATWKRVWKKFDVLSPELEDVVRSKKFKELFPENKERNYFKSWLKIWMDKKKKNEANAWGPFFFFFIIYNNYFSIVPKVNLATNIGTAGVHTRGKLNIHFWPTDPNFRVKEYTVEVKHTVKYDKHHFCNHLNVEVPPKIIIRLINKFFNLFSKIK